MSTRAGRRWAVVAAASGTVLIGAGAFWLSFVALADLAVRSGIVAGQAWILPLLVDGLIVVATVAVVALDGHRAAWYPWTLLIAGAGMSVTANAAHALVTAEASVPGVLAATVAAVPPLVLLASTHLTVVLTRPATPAEQAPVQEVAVLSADPREQTGAAQRLALLERAAPSVDAEPEPTPRPPRPATDPIPAVPTGPEPEPAHEPTAEPPAPPELDTSDEASTDPAAAQDARPAPASKEAGSVPDRRARAVALREAGWSNKQIARELGVHASTVGRWFPRPTGSSGESETPMKEDKEKDHEPERA